MPDFKGLQWFASLICRTQAAQHGEQYFNQRSADWGLKYILSCLFNSKYERLLIFALHFLISQLSFNVWVVNREMEGRITFTMIKILIIIYSKISLCCFKHSHATCLPNTWNFTTQHYQEQSGTQKCQQKIKQGMEHWVTAHGLWFSKTFHEGAATLWEGEWMSLRRQQRLHWGPRNSRPEGSDVHKALSP